MSIAAGVPDLGAFTPLKAEDHQRCGMAYTMKVRGDRVSSLQRQC